MLPEDRSPCRVVEEDLVDIPDGVAAARPDHAAATLAADIVRFLEDVFILNLPARMCL